ncbi:MAG: hypothetical protein KA999_06820 [Acinetobacter sp.]|nr:hypothetical protein [Acinetobacter sp.]
MAVSRSIWQHIQHYSWVVFAIICLIAALIFWAVSESDDVVEVKQTAKTETQVQIQPEKVAVTTHLGALVKEVNPLDLSARVVVANEHAAEFRGTKFIKENQRQWTMEIFRSSEEAIIKNFLASRADRAQFIYFRLSGQDQLEQYVLVYGAFANAELAKRQFAQLNLQLPQSIQPQPHLLSSYAEFINDLGSDELKSSTSPLYAIQLKPAALPKVDETLVRDSSPRASSVGRENSTVIDSASTVKTTVTQRDAQGNVVNVEQSHSNAEKLKENSKNSSAVVSDPFN